MVPLSRETKRLSDVNSQAAEGTAANGLEASPSDNVVQDQEVVELEEETECYTIVEAVEQYT